MPDAPAKPAPEFLNGYVVDDRVWLFSRNADGVLLRRQVPAEYSCFLRAADVDEQLDRMLRKSAVVAGFKIEGDWVRVRWRGPDVRKQVCGPKGWFAERCIQTFEGDVSPVRRWFADTGANIQAPRPCYLDIETDSRVPANRARDGEARILCWCVEAPDGSRVQGLLADDTDQAERDLLSALWAALEPFDQIRSWYGDGFDFPVIRRRTSLLRPRVKDPRRWLYVDQLEVYERVNVAAESGDEKESLALKKVQHHHLGKHPDDAELLKDEDFSARGSWGAWASGDEGRRQLLEYNARDTRRQRRIEEETGFLAIHLEFCRIASVFPDTYGAQPVAQVDGYVLRRGVERNQHFATRQHRSMAEQEGDEAYKGALVIAPTRKGIVKDVHVFDFSGMYPSIVLSFNMSPETKRTVPVNGPVPPGHVRLPTSARTGFALDPIGIISAALDEILALKDYWGRRKAELAPGTPEWIDADRKATAYKVASNSFYGVLGSVFSRFFDKAIAEGITQTGVWLIQETLAAAKRLHAMDTVYGDTDSGFVADALEEAVRAFVAWCNAELYPKLLGDCGVPRDRVRVKLAYEKMFERLIFSSNAAGEAVKKRYVGVYAHYKGKRATRDSKPEVKGLEWKRGDSSKIARAMQYDVIRLLTGYDLDDGLPRPKGAEKNARVPLKGYGDGKPCEDAGEFRRLVEAWRHYVLEEPLPRDLVKVTKGLSKPLSEYVVKKKADGSDGASPPHVRVARELVARGHDVGEGSKIDYVVVDGEASPLGVVPAIDYKGELDRHYLWEKQVYPATMRLLMGAFPDGGWDAYEASRPPSEKQLERARKRVAREAQEAERAQAAPRTPEARQGAPRSRRGGKAPTEQRSLFDGSAGPALPPRVGVLSAEHSKVSRPVASTTVVRIAVGEGWGADDALVLRSVLEDYPGTKRVLIERAGVDDDELSRAVAGIRVSGDDAMWDAVEGVLA